MKSKMWFNSLKWPSSTMRSASSRTRTSMEGSSWARYSFGKSLMNSQSLPGVPMTISGLVLRSLSCFSLEIWPTIVTAFILEPSGITFYAWSWICMANSLVGAIIRALKFWPSPPASFTWRIRSRIGKTKHKVLPYPVLAAIIRSPLAFRSYRDWSCTSVG